MKRLATILCFLIAGVAVAQVPEKREGSKAYTVTATTATGSAPTVFTVASISATGGYTAGEAVDLNGASGIRVELCAASGQTLAGAGQLDVYLKNKNNEVLFNKELSAALAVGLSSTSCTGAACRCRIWPDFKVSGSAFGGAMLAVPNGVTVSGGADVTVRLRAIVSNSR